MQARIVTTKERKYGDTMRREGSPVPGVELYDSTTGIFIKSYFLCTLYYYIQ